MLKCGDIILTYGYTDRSFERFMIISDKDGGLPLPYMILDLSNYDVNNSFKSIEELEKLIKKYIITTYNISDNLDDIIDDDYSNSYFGSIVETFLDEIGGIDGFVSLQEKPYFKNLSNSCILSKIDNSEIDAFDNKTEAIMHLYGNGKALEQDLKNILDKSISNKDKGKDLSDLLIENSEYIYKINEKYITILE